MSPGIKKKKSKSPVRLVEGGPPTMDRAKLMMQQDGKSQHSGSVAIRKDEKATPKRGSWSPFRAMLGGKKKDKKGSNNNMQESDNKLFAATSEVRHAAPAKRGSKLALLKFGKGSKSSAGHSQVKDFNNNDDANFEFTMPGLRDSGRMSGRKKPSGGSALNKRVTESTPAPVVGPSKEQAAKMLDYSSPLKRNIAKGKPLMGTTRTVIDGYEEIETIKPKVARYHSPGPPQSAPPAGHSASLGVGSETTYSEPPERSRVATVTKMAPPRAIVESSGGGQNETRSTKNASGRFQTAGVITAQSVGGARRGTAVQGDENSQNVFARAIGNDSNMSVNERLKLRARNGFKR